MTPLENHVSDIETTDPVKITTMGGKITAKKLGKLRISERVDIKNVLVVPQAPYTLFSLSESTKKGYSVIFTAEGAYLVASTKAVETHIDALISKSILKGTRKGNLWVSNIYKPSKEHDERLHVESGIQQKIKTNANPIPKKPQSAIKPQSEKKEAPKVPTSEEKSSFSPKVKSPQKKLNFDKTAASGNAALNEDSDSQSDNGTSDIEYGEGEY
jgi:hypothetical protein